MPPRTIDNLGVDASTRYAEDKKALDENIIRGAREIPIQTEVEVSAPFFSEEMQALLHLQPANISWALFIPPAGYFEQRKRLFTFQLIPSIGSEDKQDSQAQKILSKLKAMVDQKKEREKGKDKKQQYEEEQLLEQEEKEKQILTSLLNTITLFDKLIIEINSKRSQYQKG